MAKKKKKEVLSAEVVEIVELVNKLNEMTAEEFLQFAKETKLRMNALAVYQSAIDNIDVEGF